MIRSVPARWHDAVLVCGKCSRKLDGGFGRKGRTPLAKLLRKAAGFGKGRKAAGGVVETGCLKLCPKRAVTVVNAARPHGWLVVAPGADPADVLRALGIGTDPAGNPPAPPRDVAG